ncbi:MAG: hypothetical protein PVJ51_10865, partial [Acidobacteriota bacterium]
MEALRNIFSVAHYERIMLARTTRFRLLGLIGIVIPMFFGVVLAIGESLGEMGEAASVFGISSFVPFYFYTYTQTVLIAFVAGNFRAADESAEVAEVIAVRPMSTAQIVLGKYLGVLQALAGLAALVALLTMSIQAAKLSFVGAPFELAPYAYYFFLMMLPALVFMSALTFSLGAMLRNRTAVALLSIAYVMAVLFFLGLRYDGFFDFGAFFAPLYYSDMLGVGDIGRLLQIRAMYLALAAGLLGLAIASYPRLPNPGLGGKVGHLLAALGVTIAAFAFVHIHDADRAAVARREALLATQVAYADVPVATVRHYDLDLTLMGEDAPLRVQATLRLVNEHDAPLPQLVFTLNPGLHVDAVRSGDAELGFEVEGSVVHIDPPAPLQPGQETEVSLTYAGDIDRNGFDLMRGHARLEKWDGPIHKGDLTAWIADGSAYLPPRSRWYPVPGVDYGHAGLRPVSFATARIAVDVPAGLTAITQGEPADGPTATPVEAGPATPDATPSPAVRGRFARSRQVWEVSRPVPVLSLNVDTYDVLQAEIGGTEVALYLSPLHMPQVEFFSDAVPEVRAFVEQIMSVMESESGLPYPYPRLSIVEIPFLVQWYYEGWEESGGLTQPGILMIEEDALIEGTTRIRSSFERTRRSERGRNQDPVRLKRDQLASAVFTAFLGSDYGYGYNGGLFRSPLVQLWSFNRTFSGSNAPVLSRGMPVYMQEDVTASMRSLIFDRNGERERGAGGAGARVQERGADDSGTISRERSIGNTRGVSWDAQLSAMQRDSLADLDAGANPDLYRAVLDTKSLTLFRVVEAVVGSGAFVGAIEAFGTSSAYAEVSFDDFERAVVPGANDQTTADAGLESLIRDWVNGTQVPGYTITRTTTLKREADFGAVVYQTIVRVRNGEPGRGLVQVQLIGDDDRVSRNVQIDGGEELEISMLLSERPHRVNIEPFLAKNRRQLGVPLRVPEEITPGPAETWVRLVPAGDAAFTEVVVDNEDEGFSMPIRRVRRYLRPGLRGDNWRVMYNSYAFGRYETNFRYKYPGDGAQPAIWRSELPHAGTYDVAYYWLPERLDNRFIRWRAADTFRITLFHAGG